MTTGASLASLFCPQLAETDRALLRNRLAGQRAERFRSILQQLHQPAVTARLGPRFARLQRFVATLLETSNDDPAALTALVHHWAITNLLAILRTSSDAASQERILDALDGILLADRLRHVRASPTTVETSANAWLPQDDRFLRVGNHPTTTRIAWSFDSDRCTARDAASAKGAHTFGVPHEPEPPLETTSLPRCRAFDLPIYEPQMVGTGRQGACDPEAAKQEGNGRGVVPWLSFDDSLEGAKAHLKTLWPEVISWIDVLVPGFVYLGVPPGPNQTLSSSYGSGSPICLSTVDHAFQQAENLAHELQHERLSLFLEPDDMPFWGDAEQCFVSPYRSDPRPLRGLFLGVHAFVAVNELRLRALAQEVDVPQKHTHLIDSHYLNLFAYRTLIEHGTYRNNGRRWISEIAEALSSQHTRIEGLATTEQISRAQRQVAAHRDEVSRAGVLRNTDDHYMSFDETVAMAPSPG